MTTRPRRTLVVVRHATAESFAATDHDRPLTTRGTQQAADLGVWLHENGLLPDAAIVSTARRTRESWQGLARAAGVEIEPLIDGAVYSGGMDSVLECVRTVDAAAGTVLVLGHNPTVASLVLDLDDGRGDPDLLVEASGGFPPSSAAVLTVTGSWVDLEPGGATLTALRIAR